MGLSITRRMTSQVNGTLHCNLIRTFIIALSMGETIYVTGFCTSLRTTTLQLSWYISNWGHKKEKYSFDVSQDYKSRMSLIQLKL